MVMPILMDQATIFPRFFFDISKVPIQFHFLLESTVKVEGGIIYYGAKDYGKNLPILNLVPTFMAYYFRWCNGKNTITDLMN